MSTTSKLYIKKTCNTTNCNDSNIKNKQKTQQNQQFKLKIESNEPLIVDLLKKYFQTSAEKSNNWKKMYYKQKQENALLKQQLKAVQKYVKMYHNIYVYMYFIN